MIDLRAAARALGGEVAGIGQVLCPAPGHSHRDRSLSVLFDPRATEGFVVNTFAAGDDPLTARDHVRARLGLEARVFSRSGENSAPPRPAVELHQDEDEAPRRRRALTIWDEAREPQRTAVEHYLASRVLELPDEVAGTVLRYHWACPFGGDRTPAMVALVRNVRNDLPQAIHRTALSYEGRKAEVNGKARLPSELARGRRKTHAGRRGYHLPRHWGGHRDHALAAPPTRIRGLTHLVGLERGRDRCLPGFTRHRMPLDRGGRRSSRQGSVRSVCRSLAPGRSRSLSRALHHCRR